MMFGCASQNYPKSAIEVLPNDFIRGTKLNYLISTAELNVSPWDVRYDDLDNPYYQNLLNYLAVFESEWSRVPKQIISVSGLKTIAFVENLFIATQQREAVPDYNHEVLYYDVRWDRKIQYKRHVIHHELYHMLEEQLYGSAFYFDPLWAQLNLPDFKYGGGGATARGSDVAALDHPHEGFVNKYAMSGLEEDKAEIWASMWTLESWLLFEPMLRKDDILLAKLNLLASQIECVVPNFVSITPTYVQSYLTDAKCPN